MIQRILSIALLNFFTLPILAEPIRFCRPNNMVSAHAYIAEHEGYFKEQGVDISFALATNAKICQDMLLGKQADVMVGADGPWTVVAPNDPPFKIIAGLGSNPETALFARIDHGITKFESLRGKKIGYLPGTVSYFFLGRILEKYKIKREEISLVSLQPPALSQALIGGAVDAISVWEPWGYNAKKVLGDKFVRLDAPSLYQYASLFTVREEFAKRPEVEGIVRAFIEAETYIKQHPTESQSILSDAVKLDPEILQSLWKDYVFTVSLSKAPLKIIEENFKLLQESDQNFRELSLGDLTRYVDSSALKKIDPKRVSLEF
jgi:ABC-type nitrate/sulfonate/bicarbonate transport system substrate-binding protein